MRDLDQPGVGQSGTDLGASHGRAIPDLLTKLDRLPADWHGAGLMSMDALEAISRLAPPRVRYSLETGSGRSTILLSHLSERHVVFAVNDGESISRVQASPLLRREVVTFVEGPSQRTLANYEFDSMLDLAVIDGPHAYPFPDLEYYRVYPHLRPGALLVIDDIHIPTIGNLCRFLAEDSMFELREKVRGRTALFVRTGASMFDPLGDGWWLQRFNMRHMPLSARIWDRIPGPVKRSVKAALRFR